MLNFEQFKILVRNDEKFLRNVWNKITSETTQTEADVYDAARNFAKKHNSNIVLAVKELREWSSNVPSNVLDTFGRDGCKLTITAAKKLVEKFINVNRF